MSGLKGLKKEEKMLQLLKEMEQDLIDKDNRIANLKLELESSQKMVSNQLMMFSRYKEQKALQMQRMDYEHSLYRCG